MYYRISAKRPEVEIVIRGVWAQFSPPYRYFPFVEDLKAEVPARDRRWDGQTWSVRVKHFDILFRLVREGFNEPEIVRELREAA